MEARISTEVLNRLPCKSLTIGQIPYIQPGNIQCERAHVNNKLVLNKNSEIMTYAGDPLQSICQACFILARHKRLSNLTTPLIPTI